MRFCASLPEFAATPPSDRTVPLPDRKSSASRKDSYPAAFGRARLQPRRKALCILLSRADFSPPGIPLQQTSLETRMAAQQQAASLLPECVRPAYRADTTDTGFATLAICGALG